MKYLFSILLAALLFWVPDVIVHLIKGRNFCGDDVRLITVLIPLVCIMGFIVYSKLHYRRFCNPAEAIAAIIGIWVMGPLATTIAATFSGGGFAASDISLGKLLIIKGTLLFPIYTFIMSAYDGTLFALMIVTLAFLVYAIIGILYQAK